MLVCVESYFGDSILSGPKCTEAALREMFLEAIRQAESGNFQPLFCRMFKFDEYPYSDDIQVDYVIDLDTYSVYKPYYGD